MNERYFGILCNGVPYLLLNILIPYQEIITINQFDHKPINYFVQTFASLYFKTLGMLFEHNDFRIIFYTKSLILLIFNLLIRYNKIIL